MATASRKTIKTRILILSDTHTRPLAPSTSSLSFRHPLPSADVLIHCGDMTLTGLIPEYHTTLDLLSTISAPVKLVIPGNHDRTLDPIWSKSHTHIQKDDYAAALDLWTSPSGRARAENVSLLLDEGVHEFVLPSGAKLKLYASGYTPEFCDWGFPYEIHQDRFNPPALALSDAESIVEAPIPSFEEEQVDVLLTHGPPLGRRDWTYRGDRVGCPHLLRAVVRARPLVHCFGHIHEGWGAEVVGWSEKAMEMGRGNCGIEAWKKGAWGKAVETVEEVEVSREVVVRERCVKVDATGLARGRETLMINAAIVDVDYEPVNAPFLVELDLPSADD